MNKKKLRNIDKRKDRRKNRLEINKVVNDKTVKDENIVEKIC